MIECIFALHVTMWTTIMCLQALLGHDSEEWCHNITILAKLPKHIIIIFHKFDSIKTIYQLPILL